MAFNPAGVDLNQHVIGAVTRMNVRRLMVLIKHRDGDAEEAAEDRHG